MAYFRVVMDASLNGRRILVVDDNDAERMLIATYLQQQGCRIYLAENGLDGIEKARMVQPDLILMDARMPECDGLNACRLLKGDPAARNIPIIFLSAFSTAEDRIKGLRYGAADYIAKPFDFNEVLLRLMVHLKPKTTTAPPLSPYPDAETGDARQKLDSLLFQAARVHLLKSLAAPPELETLARLIGTNRKRLTAAFKACVGMGVFEYLREERMKEAALLLRNTNKTVETIGQQLGFASGANFSTAFRERFRMTPTQFRAHAGAPPAP